MRFVVRVLPAVLGLVAACAAPAQAPAPGKRSPKMSVAYFSELQEHVPFTPEEMSARHAQAGDDPDGIAADTALNDWKLCVLDSLNHWSELKEGAGLLIDGAYGRCGDLERQYRSHLMAITQDGRAVMDFAMARTMITNLEGVWRPRLVATVLDQELARQQAAAAKAAEEAAHGKDRRDGRQ